MKYNRHNTYMTLISNRLKHVLFVSGAILASSAYAELTPLDNAELADVNGEGIALRLEVGLSANPSTNAYVDPSVDEGLNTLWETGFTNRSRLLGDCAVTYNGGNVGNISSCTRRLAIEYPEANNTIGSLKSPFAILFDNFAISATFEEIRMELIEKSAGSDSGMLKLSFPGKIDISRFTIEKLSFVPLTGATDATSPMNLAADTTVANSLYAYDNGQINLLGIDVNATFQLDGDLYVFAHDLSVAGYGAAPQTGFLR